MFMRQVGLSNWGKHTAGGKQDIPPQQHQMTEEEEKEKEKEEVEEKEVKAAAKPPHCCKIYGSKHL